MLCCDSGPHALKLTYRFPRRCKRINSLLETRNPNQTFSFLEIVSSSQYCWNKGQSVVELKYNYSESYDVHRRPPRVRLKSFLLHLVQFHSKAETFFYFVTSVEFEFDCLELNRKWYWIYLTCGIRSCWTTVTVYKITNDFNWIEFKILSQCLTNL